MSNKKYLILGSNSFSGSVFCEYLAKKGHQVIATSRSNEKESMFLPYKNENFSNLVTFYKLDINKDIDTLRKILFEEEPSFIINFAAQSMVGQSWEFPEDWMMTNVVSMAKLQNLLLKYNNLEKYVHVTTPEVYGSTDNWISENYNYNPSTPYAVSRAASDMNVKIYSENFNFPSVMTRAANVYGAGQQLYRIIPRTIYAALTGEKISLHGGGISERVFIHIKDVCDATYKITNYGRNGECYHISSNELISIRDCVDLILTIMEKKFDDCVTISEDRVGKDNAYKLDSSKLRQEFSWKPKISLEQGIRENIEWMKKNEKFITKKHLIYSHKK